MTTFTDMGLVRLYQAPLPTDKCPQDGRCEDRFPLFLYCVVVTAIVVCLVLLVVAVITCCSRKSCSCKKYATLETQNEAIQMDSYNTIKRASVNLRHMSNNRETPMMLPRSGSSTLDRSSRRRHQRARESCHSAPGSLLRQNRHRPPSTSPNEPPPPPAYGIHSDDMFLGPEFLPPSRDMQSSVRYEDSTENNENGAQPFLYHHYYDNER